MLVVVEGEPASLTCRIEGAAPPQPSSLVTSLSLLAVKPVISVEPREVLVVVEGEPASLTCRIEGGSPTPAITWRRKRLDEEVTRGQVLAWKSVTRSVFLLLEQLRGIAMWDVCLLIIFFQVIMTKYNLENLFIWLKYCAVFFK